MDRVKKYVNNKVTKIVLMLIIISVIGGATVLYINHEKNEQIKMERLQAERQAAIDDATARAQQAEIDAKAERQKLMQTTINKIKDYGEIVVMKYEFSHETSYEKSGALPFLSKNMLKLKIDYETEYKINISNLSIYVDNDEIYLVYNPKDFELLASVKKITKQATDKKEQGWIPVDFTNEETIALIIVVFPVPGPPVMIVKLLFKDLIIAFRWLSSYVISLIYSSSSIFFSSLGKLFLSKLFR